MLYYSVYAFHTVSVVSAFYSTFVCYAFYAGDIFLNVHGHYNPTAHNLQDNYVLI